MTKTVEQTWNFDLDAAKGKGFVILVGYNNYNKESRWQMEATLTDEGWVRANTYKLMDFGASTPVAWAELNFPF